MASSALSTDLCCSDGSLNVLLTACLLARPREAGLRLRCSLLDGQAAQLLANLAAHAFELDQSGLFFGVVTRNGRLEFRHETADVNLLDPQKQLLQDDRRERF